MATKKVVSVTEEGLVDESTLTVTDQEIEIDLDEPVMLEAEEVVQVEEVAYPVDTLQARIQGREYRLELFEQGDNRVFGRQRGLAREGWDFPVIHGFQRNLTMNRGTDRFLIVVASRDLDVPLLAEAKRLRAIVRTIMDYRARGGSVDQIDSDIGHFWDCCEEALAGVR